jgi:type IV pilus assembly protein PilB
MLAGETQTGEFLNVVLAGGLTNRASDIHFETADGGSARLRYRIDGSLETVIDSIPKEVYKLVLLRIKLLANLRLNTDTIAQDGAFAFKLGDLEIELRVATAPSEFGEAIVMRILDPRSIQITLDKLGIREDDLQIIKEELRAPNGMILNTGPTGSGKTTTLYAFLRTLATADTKIITIEDPIEYHVAGIEQTQANEKSGYTFAGGLRSMMRQDPDIILVGEIRDTETTQLALQAALTGHLVFSTLHTNDAATAIPRLIDLGGEPFLIASVLNAVVAQRIVRKIDPNKAEEYTPEPEVIENIKSVLGPLFPEKYNANPESLKILRRTDTSTASAGYYGRVGLFEVLQISRQIDKLIMGNSTAKEIKDQARAEGLITMKQDGYLKVLDKVTTIEEILRVAESE